VHAAVCATAMEQPEERRIDVSWDGEHKSARPVSVQVVCTDKPGLLALISQTFNDLGLNIASANCRALDDDRAVNTFRINVIDVDQLHKVIRALQKIQGVSAVQRI
jgi:guanosine-3',5'-bis(diphosphate) 3'-pyrophosphohydrolase